METIPRPVEPIEYYSAGEQTISRVVRTIGVLGLVIGGISFVVLPLNWIVFLRRSWLWQDSVLWWILSSALFAIAIVLIVGSSLCLRRSPRCRIWMLVYAYGYFIYIFCAMGLDIWWILPRAMKTMDYSTMLVSEMVRFSMGISFPILVAVVMAQREVRQFFASGNH